MRDTSDEARMISPSDVVCIDIVTVRKPAGLVKLSLFVVGSVSFWARLIDSQTSWQRVVSMAIGVWLRALAPVMLITSAASAQLESPCVQDSPERHGELGCSIVEIKALPSPLGRSLSWHIDRFDSGESARASVTPLSIALEAHGSWWLLSLDTTARDHHGGKHVAIVKLPPLPPAAKYSMLVISAYVASGLTSRIHTHSGVEGFYVVEGEQCLETAARADTMRKGEGLAVATGVAMRLVAIGPTPRRALAVIVFDASQPPTTRMESGPSLVRCM